MTRPRVRFVSTRLPSGARLYPNALLPRYPQSNPPGVDPVYSRWLDTMERTWKGRVAGDKSTHREIWEKNVDVLWECYHGRLTRPFPRDVAGVIAQALGDLLVTGQLPDSLEALRQSRPGAPPAGSIEETWIVPVALYLASSTHPQMVGAFKERGIRSARARAADVIAVTIDSIDDFRKKAEQSPRMREAADAVRFFEARKLRVHLALQQVGAEFEGAGWYSPIEIDGQSPSQILDELEDLLQNAARMYMKHGRVRGNRRS